MPTTADLEISLDHWDNAPHYRAVARYQHPGDAAFQAPAQDLVQFDFKSLNALLLDVPAYGKSLTHSLLRPGSKLKELVVFALRQAEFNEENVRFRLLIETSAAPLQTLRWETLRHPDTDAWLLGNPRILFSRFLGTEGFERIRLRRRGELRALVALANPANLAEFNMPPIDPALEYPPIRASLLPIPAENLNDSGPITLAHLRKHLQKEYDLLHLVSHGAIRDGRSELWLEEQVNGKWVRTSGDRLVELLRSLPCRPRLVVLQSCQSGGTGPGKPVLEEGMLAALGPSLAEAGIPAVLAIQGDISVTSAATFMTTFFRELQSEGEIDHAVAAARCAIFDQHDAWMPILFLRLKGGKIWYVPGFDEDEQVFPRWPTLLDYIAKQHCTPILGGGLLEDYLDSQQIAYRLAQKHHFPLAPHERDNLTQVAQFIEVIQSDSLVRTELAAEIKKGLGERFQQVTATAEVQDCLAEVAQARRQHGSYEPHALLAELPFALFVSTNADRLLGDALREAGKAPKEMLWHQDEVSELPPNLRPERDFVPTEKQPLIYHLFGRWENPETLVLTEDNYFDFLIEFTANREMIASAVKRALTDSALLFIGFHLEDWAFRVLFRMIMGLEGGNRRKRYKHIAVQINPEEERFLDPQRARKFLQQAFQDAAISIYWGSVPDFLQELQKQWRQGHGQPVLEKGAQG